jgi:predicted  nucleic acid-binding Zn-ribbon protein
VPRALGHALLLTLVAVLLCGAELYKWVDENGVVHYSETPPQDQAATAIELAPAPAQPDRGEESRETDETAASGVAWYEQWLAEQRERKQLARQQAEEKSLSRAEEETRLLEQCTTARRRLEILETACPVFFDGQGVLRVKCPHETIWVHKGELRYLSDEERTNMLRHYRQQVADCEAQGY